MDFLDKESYHSWGNTLEEVRQTVTLATTMTEIVQYLNSPMTPGIPTPPTGLPPIYTPDPARGALKLHVNSLTEFSVQPIEYEQWELAARATLVGQFVYGSLLDDPSTPGDVVMEARNKEPFHMLVMTLMKGSGMHLLQVNKVVDNGHMAYTSSIKEWYGSAASMSQSIIDHYRKKLEGLHLDNNISASEYVNVFQICCQKFEAKNKGYTSDTKRQRFLDQILLDDDYDVLVKQNLQGNSDLAFKYCGKRIRQREQDLQIDAGETALKKARRFKKDKKTKPKGQARYIFRRQNPKHS
jgi:hypothetical protein